MCAIMEIKHPCEDAAVSFPNSFNNMRDWKIAGVDATWTAELTTFVQLDRPDSTVLKCDPANDLTFFIGSYRLNGDMLLPIVDAGFDDLASMYQLSSGNELI